MLKKTCAVLMSCLVLGATPAPVWAADASGAVKTLTRTENKVTVECPQVTGGSRAADEKINRALSSQAASFYERCYPTTQLLRREVLCCR